METVTNQCNTFQQENKMSSTNKSNPSLCVPRVFPNITWQRVKDVFEDLGLGEVERVDMVNKTNDNGEKFKRVFVHFKRWSKNETALQVKEKLLSGDSVKVVYDDPWFWKVFMSNAPKPEWNTKPRKQTKPRISQDDDDRRHPGAPTPARAATQIEELKALMAEQRREMERMRDEMERMSGTASPGYSPHTPPTMGGPRLPEPPKMVRQTAKYHEQIEPITISAPLARASTEMSPAMREKVEAEAAAAASPPVSDN